MALACGLVASDVKRTVLEQRQGVGPACCAPARGSALEVGQVALAVLIASPRLDGTVLEQREGVVNASCDMDRLAALEVVHIVLDVTCSFYTS